MPRLYQPVWEEIKKKGRAVLSVHPVMAARVKKAVSKEKDMDTGFKVLNDHDHFYLRVSYDKDRKRMTFVLKQSIGIEERVV